MATLKTDYTDAVWSGDRRVQITPDGETAYTASIEDVTTYDNAGDTFSADDINATNTQVNTNTTALGNLNNITQSTDFTYESNFAAYGSSEKTLPVAIKCGRIVELYGTFKPTSSISSTKSDGVLMGHVPSGFEPYRIVQRVQNGPDQSKFLLVITTDGGLYVSRLNTSNTTASSGVALRINCVYISAT